MGVAGVDGEFHGGAVEAAGEVEPVEGRDVVAILDHQRDAVILGLFDHGGHDLVAGGDDAVLQRGRVAPPGLSP
jgi:hypothetical protein